LRKAGAESAAGAASTDAGATGSSSAIEALAIRAAISISAGATTEASGELGRAVERLERLTERSQSPYTNSKTSWIAASAARVVSNTVQPR
jgi:hypothetical protein